MEDEVGLIVTGDLSDLTEAGFDLAIERLFFDRGHLCVGRALPAPLDHRANMALIAGKDGLDRAVGQVPNPAVKAKALCLADRPAAKPDPLDAAFDVDLDLAGLAGHQRSISTIAIRLGCSGLAKDDGVFPLLLRQHEIPMLDLAAQQAAMANAA